MLKFTGISNATWSDYENGKTEPKLDRLIEISELFGISVTSLLTVDLSEKVPIEQKDSGKKDGQKSTYENTNTGTNEGHFLVHEVGEDLKKQQTDLLILSQLNLLTKEIKQLAEKLDK
jgi:transcriptional regulator with XRE-family HTH domain